MSNKDEEKNKYVGIIGSGVLVKSLVNIYTNSCFGKPVINSMGEKNEFDYNTEMDVLNVCIPYNKEFINDVRSEVMKTNAKMVIIHSIVEPYATKKIKRRTNKCVIYMPVIGTHGNIQDGFTFFRKFVGVEDGKDEKMAKEHLDLLNFRRKPVYIKPAVIVEMNKLIDNVYMGVCLSYTDYIDALCKVYNIPFKLFEAYNENVNRGYRRMKVRKWNRPTLFPPNGKIKSKNIIDSAKMLKKCLKHKIVDNVLDLK